MGERWNVPKEAPETWSIPKPDLHVLCWRTQGLTPDTASVVVAEPKLSPEGTVDVEHSH